MTKEFFINKWIAFDKNDFIADIDAVIATEVAKAMKQPIRDQPQPKLNPIEQAYERGEMMRRKDWGTGVWIQKKSENESVDETGYLFGKNWGFDEHPEKWEIYTEPVHDAVHDTVQPEAKQPAPQFDRERFEAMFRAVLETHEATMNALKQLDAYYAKKEKGGSND